jgi:hypothetical protein
MYKLDANSGGFVEGEFEGVVQLTSRLQGTLWGMGSWLQVTGTGKLESSVAVSEAQGGADDPTLASIPGNVDIENSKYQRSFFALGLGLSACF